MLVIFIEKYECKKNPKLNWEIYFSPEEVLEICHESAGCDSKGEM
jgi:hypothetical protein